jgi:hypothetical protein
MVELFSPRTGNVSQDKMLKITCPTNSGQASPQEEMRRKMKCWEPKPVEIFRSYPQ